jgi:hypothetical protein
MKKHAAALPRSIYIVLVSAFLANVVATFIMVRYFL